MEIQHRRLLNLDPLDDVDAPQARAMQLFNFFDTERAIVDSYIVDDSVGWPFPLRGTRRCDSDAPRECAIVLQRGIWRESIRPQ